MKFLPVIILSLFSLSAIASSRVVTAVAIGDESAPSDSAVLRAVLEDARVKCGWGFEPISMSELRKIKLANGKYRFEAQFECVQLDSPLAP